MESEANDPQVTKNSKHLAPCPEAEFTPGSTDFEIDNTEINIFFLNLQGFFISKVLSCVSIKTNALS
jgi:hypothetical protein